MLDCLKSLKFELYTKHFYTQLKMEILKYVDMKKKYNLVHKQISDYCQSNSIPTEVCDMIKSLHINTLKSISMQKKQNKTNVSDEILFNLYFDLQIIKNFDMNYLIEKLLPKLQEFDKYMMDLIVEDIYTDVQNIKN